MPDNATPFRWPAVATLAGKIGAVALIVANDPQVIATVAGKVGVSSVLLLSIASAVQKSLSREAQ
jgi:hypothetical protein